MHTKAHVLEVGYTRHP